MGEVEQSFGPDQHRGRSAGADKWRPILDLSPRLRRIVQELESRAAFMDSPLGFSNEEQWAARDDAQEIVGDLSASEVEAIVWFYRHPDSQKLPLTGFELVGVTLYERWGKVAGASAVESITKELAEAVKRGGDGWDFDAPFRSGPTIYEIAMVFRGWEETNREASEEGLRRMASELRDVGINGVEDTIHQKLEEFSQPPGALKDGEDPFAE